MKVLLLSFFIASSLFSNEVVEEQTSNINTQENITIDLNYIKTLKKGTSRDFYINEFLKTKISSEEAFDTLSLIDNMTNEIFFNFANKFNHDETLAVAQCMNMDAKHLVESYSDCIVSGLTLEKMSKLSSVDLELIKQKTLKKYPEFVKSLKVISSSIPFTKLIIQKKDTFYNIFFNVSNEFRTKYFNYKLPKRTFQKIFKDKKKFNSFLQISLTNKKLNVLNKSLHKIDDEDLNANSSFLLALNAIRLNDINSAMNYLHNAILKTNDLISLDKIKFWKYLLSKDEEILIDLSKSENLNFYSYLAKELLGNKISKKGLIQNIENFDNLLNKYTKERVALLYSIAKIKSNFETKKISKDFEIGIMQLKPSSIKSISNTINEEYGILNQFKISESLKYANLYLNNLEKFYKSPLFLSLAYDDKVVEEIIFEKNIFEPFYSIELFLNEENDIKKEVLLYYVLYYNSFTKKKREKISLLSIYQNLNLSDHKQGE